MLSNIMKKYQSKNGYFAKYTIFFVLLCIIVYGYFWSAGKSFVWNQLSNDGDGLIQHYTALCYYATYLRNIIKTIILQHKFIIPEWSFSIGYGSNILTTLHYYVIGDPFNLLSVLVPTRYMPYYYSFMILFRMYCAGLAFSAYSFHMTKEKKDYSEYAVLAGAIIYIFCMYGLSSGIKHPYFINPMVFFPLLLLGAEKVMKKQSPVLFMITVAVSACSNFYFFYMLVLLTVMYVFVRLFTWYGYRQIRIIGCQILRLFLYSAIGLGTGMVLFLPVVLTVFQDSRFGNGTPLQIAYDMKYYASFLGSFISTTSGGHWCIMGFSAISLSAVILMFCRIKKHRLLAVGFAVSTIMLMIPAVNYALNGFSYAASRWIWAYAFLVSYIVTRMWPELLKISSIYSNVTFLSLSGYFLICILLDHSRTEDMAFAMVCAFAMLCLFQLQISIRWKEYIALLLIVVNIGMNGYFMFSFHNNDTTENYADWHKVNILVFDSFDDAVAEASADDDSDFFRFSQEFSNNNATLLSGLHSIQYYWSLSNNAIIEANNELGILEFTHNMYYDLNSRIRLTNLANVKYYIAPSGRSSMYAPYDFLFKGTYSAGGKDYDVYENQNALPFGYTYDSVLESARFEKASSIEKEELMFQGAYLGEYKANLPLKNTVTTSEKIPYTISCKSDDVTYKDNCFTVTKEGASVVLNFDGMKECETFLQFKGLKYRGCSPLERYKDNSEFDPLNLYTAKDLQEKSPLEKKKLKYKNRNWKEKDFLSLTVIGFDDEQRSLGQGMWLLNPGYTWYSGKEDFTVNLRYSDAKRTSVEISFPYEGIYSFDSLSVECLPVKNYHNHLDSLQEESMRDVCFDTDCVTGNITVTTPKLLCLTIPYEKGWSAYVDGKETEIIKTNYMYSGILLDKGKHEIELIYHTPGLRIGLIVSLICSIILIGFCLKDIKTFGKNQIRLIKE